MQSAKKYASGVKQSDSRLKAYRDNRIAFLRQFAGPYYTSGDGAPEEAEPLNTIFQLVSLYGPHLVYQNPKAMVSTTFPELRAEGNKLELGLNHLFNEIDFRSTLRTCVVDALFGVGIVKCGLTSGGQQYEVDGYLHDNGQPFCDAVDIDDYVIDPEARRREEAWFEGNRYKMPLSYLREASGYNEKVVDTLKPRENYGNNRKSEDLSRADYKVDEEKLIDYVELIDLWLPKENILVTMAANPDDVQGFVREMQWEGPERGPYEMLGYHWVPNNLLPLPLVSVIYDLHVLLNKQARKLGRQADRQKDLVLFDRTKAEEAKEVQGANDGEMVGVDNVDRFNQVSFGGLNDKGFQNAEMLKNWLSIYGGNTDLLGGIMAQSETLGQDQMLMQNASIRVDDMRAQVHHFTKKIIERLAWYLTSDPLIRLPLVKEVAGVQVPITYSAEEREGDFLDFSFDLQPHSMMADTPSRKYQRLQLAMNDVVVPLIQLGAAQGMMLEVDKVSDLTADLLNLPELKEIFSMQQPQVQVDAPINQGSIETNIRTGAQGGSASPQEKEQGTAT